MLEPVCCKKWQKKYWESLFLLLGFWPVIHVIFKVSWQYASLLERATVVFYHRAMFVINQIVSRLAEKSASVSTLAWSHVASCQICIEVGKMNDPERIHDT